MADYPWVASTLALLYRFRAGGDLAENWLRRVQYLQLAISQLSPDEEPEKWAGPQNELAWPRLKSRAAILPMRCRGELRCTWRLCGCSNATASEMQPRQTYLRQVYRRETTPWIETCIYLCECYLFSLGDWNANRIEAETFGRKAVEACAHGGTPDLRRRARLSLGRVLARSRGREASANLHEAIQWFELASEDCDPAKPELLANIRSLEASSHLS